MIDFIGVKETPALVEIKGEFAISMAKGLEAVGMLFGYEGVCCEQCRGCMWEDFPACGDICKDGVYGYMCRTTLCANGAECRCMTPDGCCPEHCPDFEVVSE